MKQVTAAGDATNNNIDIIYSLIINYSVEKKLDFITLSIRSDKYEKQIYSLLELYKFRLVSNEKLGKGNYDIKRTYKSDNDIASIEIMRGVKKRFYPALLIKIHDANRELLSILDSFFKYNSIKITVSVIEMTFDFSTDDRIKFIEFMKSHLVLKHTRAKANSGYRTTFYTNDIRTSAKGMRVYDDAFKGNDKKMVRMELVLNRAVIRKLGLEFPLSSIDLVDLSKFFSFKVINEKRIKDYLFWKHRKRIAAAEERRKGMGSLFKAHLNSHLSCILVKESLMENLDNLKSEKRMIPNYSRFIEPLDWFNSDFLERASSDNFIKSKTILSFDA
ncbi:MAG: hypothetical protein ABSC54_05335 [Smithellaceae bacterium]|jgi:hypothetical protein